MYFFNGTYGIQYMFLKYYLTVLLMRSMLISRPDKYIETSEHGLVVMNVNEADAGRYDCKMGGDIVCSYNITVDAHRCSAPARTNDFQKVRAILYSEIFF